MPEPTEPSPEQPILSFEEFIAKSPRTEYPHYNNFHVFFDTGDGAIYREEQCYKRFAQEHANIAASLFERISKRNKRDEASLKPLERDLYEAYKIMRSYGVSDDALFA